MAQHPAPTPARRSMGFRHAARLVDDSLRGAGAKRGFAVMRLLTRWDEIVGPEAARLARPVKLSWAGRKRPAGGADGLGATLTLAASGAAAPLVQMMLPEIRERVNAFHGYAAVRRIVLTQTAPDGFAEAQAAFAPAPRAGTAGGTAPAPDPDPDDTLSARAATLAGEVRDPTLRAALEALARNVLSRAETTKGLPR